MPSEYATLTRLRLDGVVFTGSQATGSSITQAVAPKRLRLRLRLRLELGGKVVPGPGNRFEPTVFTGVSHDMLLMREASSGPIIGIPQVSGDDGARALMNDTRCGQAAGAYTRDQTRARERLSQLHAGSVCGNGCDRVSPRLPWSDQGDSGVGLARSDYGIQGFTRAKPGMCASPDASHALRPRPGAARRRPRPAGVRMAVRPLQRPLAGRAEHARRPARAPARRAGAALT